MAEDRIFERRRYWAVLIQHSSLQGLADLRKFVGFRIGESHRVALPKCGWRATRFEYLANHSHYPVHRYDPSRNRDGGYAHDFYIAARSRLNGDNAGSPLLIGSPYIRLLDQLMGELRRRLPGEAPQFSSFSMQETYQAFQAGIPEMAATRVTLEILNEPGELVELVSLSGKNPLRSDLHDAINKVAAPYSLRAEVQSDSGRSRVSVDRHGNFWWYLAGEDRLSNTLRLVDTLEALRVTKMTRSLPLDRADETEDA